MEGEGTPFRVGVNAASRYRRFATPSPSKPPSSSPNFPQPGFVYSTSELSMLREQNAVRWAGVTQTPAEESFCGMGRFGIWKKSGYRIPAVGGTLFLPGGQKFAVYRLAGIGVCCG